MVKSFVRATLFLVVVMVASCTRPTPKTTQNSEPSPTTYENELFSVEIPEGWVCDDENWNGLESMKNEVNIYNPYKSIVWFHIVKAFMPIQWKNITEATEMAKAARALSGAKAELIDEKDSVEVGGYPTSILYFANYENGDTLIQKQYVTYMKDSHIVIYFNENFNSKDKEKAQELGDKIIATIKLKQVKNPLDNDSIMRQAVQAAMDNKEISDEAINKGKEIINGK
jgi:hypothetical protein